MLLVQTEDRLTATPAVGETDDARPGAPSPDRRYDLTERHHGAIARLAIGGAQLRPYDGVADKCIQRKVAIGLLVSGEEPPLLLTVQWIVGCVRIDHHLT